MSLINDLFPGIVLDKAGYPELEQAIANQVEEAGLINHPSWRLKLIQVIICVVGMPDAASCFLISVREDCDLEEWLCPLYLRARRKDFLETSICAISKGASRVECHCLSR